MRMLSPESSLMNGFSSQMWGDAGLSSFGLFHENVSFSLSVHAWRDRNIKLET